MAVSGRFALLVALGVVPVVAAGIQGASVAWLALGGWLAIVIGAGILDLSLAASPRRVILTRSLPDRVRLGETVTAELSVQNVGSRMLRAVVRDGWEPSAGVAGPNRTRLRIPPGERRRMSLELTPSRRGDRRTEHVTVRSAGPLGLWARQATLAAPGRLRVLPPFHSRAHLRSRLTRLREIDGRTPILIRGQGTEFDSIREYVRGDDVRSIDWRATARHADPEVPGSTRLMVRTWRPERDRRIVIVADTSRTAAARIADEPRLDTAWEAALLLAALASHAGDRVEFLAWDRRVRGRVHGASGPGLLAQMVDAMAGIEAELIEADWSAVPGHVRRATSRHALVVLLTAADTPGTARGLLSVLPQLTARHTVVVASVADPALVEARRARGSLDEVYAASAAERGLLDADRYLELKATGRL